MIVQQTAAYSMYFCFKQRKKGKTPIISTGKMKIKKKMHFKKSSYIDRKLLGDSKKDAHA